MKVLQKVFCLALVATLLIGCGVPQPHQGRAVRGLGFATVSAWVVSWFTKCPAYIGAGAAAGALVGAFSYELTGRFPTPRHGSVAYSAKGGNITFTLKEKEKYFYPEKDTMYQRKRNRVIYLGREIVKRGAVAEVRGHGSSAELAKERAEKIAKILRREGANVANVSWEEVADEKQQRIEIIVHEAEKV